ncbi:MAG: hypothetical protein HPY45_01110 [Anaerolineae bacterium]|nr:hypothetical protein [Anaerolineae bacterium]
MFHFLARVKFSLRWYVLALLAVCLLAFGLLIPRLGFYWDDFETILLIKQYPLAEFWRYFGANRPLAGWTYVLVSPLLGTRPLVWHIFTLALRWLSVLGMWWAFASLWPRCRFVVGWAAMLFAVYPIFVQQPIAVAYHQHWMAYLLYFLSLGLMIRATRHPRHGVLLTILAVVAQILNLVIFEYFYGVELLRPFLLWLVFEGSTKDRGKRLLLAVKHWLPYLVVMVAFLGWRVYFAATAPSDTDRPVLLFDLLKQPFATLLWLLQMALQDMLFILVTGWYRTLQPQMVELAANFSALVWLVVVVSAIGVMFFLNRFEEEGGQVESGEEKRFIYQMAWVGLLAVFLGTLPVWMTGRQSSLLAQNADRFSLVSMFGASLVLTAVIWWLIARKFQRALIFGILIGLSVGLHLRVANEYRWSWVAQQRVYWQLFWRAPAIEPNTNILADDYLFSFVDPTFSFNLLYLQPSGGSTRLSYYFNLLDRHFEGNESAWLMGTQIRAERRQFNFSASSLDSLILFYNPPVTGCLWVLSAEDKDTPYLSSLVYKALPLVNLNRIRPQPASSDYPPREIFGNEPEHGWCYYYQRAELARQMQDWQQVVWLAEQARQKGYSPGEGVSESPHEWLPFIEGYLRLGFWQEAEQLTLAAYQSDAQYSQALCRLWQRAGEGAPDVSGIRAALNCP